MDVIFPVKNRGQLRMRLVAQPDKPVAELRSFARDAIMARREENKVV
jgi:hypothetical protein